MKKTLTIVALALLSLALCGCGGKITKPQNLAIVNCNTWGQRDGKPMYILGLNDIRDSMDLGVNIWTITPPSATYSYAICYKDGTNDWKPLE